MILRITIQIFLAILLFFLIFITYFHKPEKITDTNIVKQEEVATLDFYTDNTDNLIENVSYKGTDNKGNFFVINSKTAKIYQDKPDLTFMKNVEAIIRLKDGKVINIYSEKAVYNQTTNDTKFQDNILVTDNINRINSDNLDFLVTKSLINIYNNVKITSEENKLITDEIIINMINNNTDISMFDKSKQVNLKLDN